MFFGQAVLLDIEFEETRPRLVHLVASGELEPPLGRAGAALDAPVLHKVAEARIRGLPCLFTGLLRVNSLVSRLPLAMLWSPAAALRARHSWLERQATKEQEMGELWASPGQVSWLEWIPLPAVILAADGSAVAVNPAWDAALPVAAHGHGWVEAIEPPFRLELRARLRLAVAAGEPGSSDCRVTGPQGSRWSRWWWCPVPPQNLVVCVAVIEDSQASATLPAVPDPADLPADVRAMAASDLRISTDLAAVVVYRLFDAGMALQSAASLLEGPLAAAVLRAADDLDQLVRQVRGVVFGTRGRPANPPPSPR